VLEPEVVLALAAGLPGARVTDAEVLSSGTQHRVLRLALDRPPGRVVARLADPAAAPAVDLARTAAASDLAGAAGVPVPAVVGLRRAASPEQWDCLLLEHAPGTPWSARLPSADCAAVAAVHAQVREVQAALRTVRFTTFGELDAGGRPGGATLLAALHRRVELRIAEPQRRVVMGRLLDREAALFPEVDGAVLVHDDLHAANLLVSDDANPC
jgi:aminoglycoside phosphotransferase (APT) family kinase protein